MKTRFSLFWVAMAMLASGPAANAQYDQPFPGSALGPQGNFQPMAGEFQLGLPGRVWFETNLADRGLGYQGSYLTLGGKTRLFEDFLDGRWLSEGQAHYSLESGRFFGNLGLSRVFSVQSAGADFTLGGWIDYDDDQQGDFAHSFTQLGLNGSIKTRKWDVIGNGYFPVGTTDYAYGDPTGATCFVDNRIVMVPGIDSALEGFDATLRLRPAVLSMVNGSVDIGGYGYQSALVDHFGGGRVRLGFQLMEGMFITTEVNHDNRFDLTGIVQLAFMYGVNARGNEYAGLARDLEPTIRNDHIVRFQQDVVFAIDPDTGRPYNVLHVDNNADPAFSNGFVQTPFSSLASAEAASIEDDIIFVHAGDGTSRNYNTGIVLKDGQMLLGGGSQHLIPVQNGRFFELCNPIGPRPLLTVGANGNAVTLANRNTVRGLEIEGNLGAMAYGIYGDGFAAGSPIDNGIIEDNVIRGAILDGVRINDLSGDWTFARNDVQNNGRDGIFLTDANDPTSVIEFEENVASNNGRHGIHLQDYDAAELTFLRNTTDGNSGDGIRLDNFLNGSGNGLALDILGHSSNGNAGSGAAILGGDGDLRILNSDFTNNATNGIQIVDWTNTQPGDETLIGITSGTSTISGNGVGINIEQNVGVQNIVMEDLAITGNTVGMRVTANTVPAVVTTNSIGNNISNNLGDGAQFSVTNGASHFVNMEDNLVSNNQGNGVRLLVGDNSGLTSSMTARLEDVTIAGNGLVTENGINARVLVDGQLDLGVNNSQVTGNVGNGIQVVADNDQQGFVNRVAVSNSAVSTNGGNGLAVATGDGTFMDVELTGSAFNANTANGVAVVASGDAGDPAVDNRTRVTMLANTANANAASGVTLAADGDAHVLANLQSNVFNNNTANGLAMTTADEAVMSARVRSNQMSNNGVRGMRVETTGSSTINTILVDNSMLTNSATGDAEFINAATSDICLAMSNNAFAFLPIFTNNSAPADFRIELDGATNGFIQADVGPGFSFGPFGSLCEPAIQAEEAAFALAGF